MTTTKATRKLYTAPPKALPTLKDVRDDMIIAMSLAKESSLRSTILTENTLELQKEELTDTIDDCIGYLESAIDNLYLVTNA